MFARVVLAGVFVWASVAKLRSPKRTAQDMATLGLPAVRGLALAVPVVELVVALGLFILPRIAAGVAVGLLLAFTGVLFIALWRRTPARCACFGIAGGTVSPWSVGRNGALIALAVLAL